MNLTSLDLNSTKRTEVNSILIMVFLFAPSLTLPLKIFMNNGVSVWFLTASLICFSLLNNKTINRNFVLLFFVANILFLLNILFVAYQDIVIDIYIEFLKFSLVALFLTIRELDYSKLLRYWYILGIINSLIWLVFLNRVVSGNLDYMFFGVSMTYSFTAVFYNYLIKRKRLDLLLLVIYFIVITFFANRGALIACIAVISIFTFHRSKRKFFYIINSIFITILFLIIDLKNIAIKIISLLNTLLINHNIYSYSINKFSLALVNGIASSSSGRDVLYSQAQDIIKDGFIPRGIGYFQYKTSEIYPHNFFLDLFIVFGFLGLGILGLLILMFIKFYSKEMDSKKRDVVTLFLIMVFFRLMFSSTFIYDTSFWILIGLLINRESRFGTRGDKIKSEQASNPKFALSQNIIPE